jgi:hypothetical protein
VARFDGTTGLLVQDSVVIIGDTGAITGVASIKIAALGLKLRDTNDTHDLTVNAGSNLTADRTFTLVTGDAARTLTMAGDATISGTNTGDQTITLTADVTGTGTGSFAATIANDAVTNAKAANMATGTFKGRSTAGTGDPEDLTAAQAAALLQGLIFTPVVIFAPSLDNPVTSDWAVNALAPAVSDPTTGALAVREFDDTIEEGVGFLLDIPAGATNIIFKGWGRAQTAPGAARTVGAKIYTRDMADGAAVSSWTAGTVLTDLAIGTNAFVTYWTQTVALSTLSLTAGRLTLFERTRRAPFAGTNLTGNYLLFGLAVAYT